MSNLTNLKIAFKDADGNPYVNYEVVVTGYESHNTLRLYAANGQLYTNDGRTLTDADGNIDVWVVDDVLVNLALLQLNTDNVIERLIGIDPVAGRGTGGGGGGEGGTVTASQIIALINSSQALRDAIFALATVDLKDSGNVTFARAFPPGEAPPSQN